MNNTTQEEQKAARQCAELIVADEFTDANSYQKLILSTIQSQTQPLRDKVKELEQAVKDQRSLASAINDAANQIVEERDFLKQQLAKTEAALKQCFECRFEADKINIITFPFRQALQPPTTMEK